MGPLSSPAQRHRRTRARAANDIMALSKSGTDLFPLRGPESHPIPAQDIRMPPVRPSFNTSKESPPPWHHITYQGGCGHHAFLLQLESNVKNILKTDLSELSFQALDLNEGAVDFLGIA